MVKRCKRCLLPESFPGITLDDKGLCTYCIEEKQFSFSNDSNEHILSDKIKCKTTFNQLMTQVKGEGEFDCLLLYSGGKDSTYLLHLLKNKYKKRILAITIDTGLEQQQTVLRIQKTVKRLQITHMFIKPKNQLYQRLYRYYIEHPFFGTYCNLCYLCQKIMHSIAIEIAMKRNIPLVTLAFSPEQAPYFELPKETLLHDWLPPELNNDCSTEEDKSYFWNPKKKDLKNLPRFLLPFYAIEYPGSKQIIKILTSHGYGSKKDFNTFINNCSLVWLLLHLDNKFKGYTLYLQGISDLLRQKKISYLKWFFIIRLGTWALNHRLMHRRDINRALQYPNLTYSDVVKIAKQISSVNL